MKCFIINQSFNLTSAMSISAGPQTAGTKYAFWASLMKFAILSIGCLVANSIDERETVSAT